MTKMLVSGLSLEQSDWDIIDELANRTGAGRSGAVRIIIREWDQLRKLSLTVMSPPPQEKE